MKVHGFTCDVMLLGWAETHNGGAKITLQLEGPDALEPFKSMTLKKGKIAGQILTCAFVEQDGNGNPVEPDAPKAKPKFPGGYCGLAVMWCNEPLFCGWLRDTFPGWWGACPTNHLIDPVSAAWMVKSICGVSSRKELDTNDHCRAKFNDLIREPYAAYRKEHGLE